VSPPSSRRLGGVRRRWRSSIAAPEPGGRIRLHEGDDFQLGGHQKWFYLRSDADAPLPLYTGLYFDVAPVHWSYGPPTPEKAKIDTLFQAVWRLVNHGVTGASVIIVFHERRVLPLMEQVHRLDEMVPSAPIEGMTLLSE
jgi:hypothetical protein